MWCIVAWGLPAVKESTKLHRVGQVTRKEWIMTIFGFFGLGPMELMLGVGGFIVLGCVIYAAVRIAIKHSKDDKKDDHS